MNVELIRGTDDPEELVCTAARNDYRSEGVIGYDFGEVMEDVDPKDGYMEESDFQAVEQVPEVVRMEAKKRSLLDHLIDRDHWGPFEHPSATLALEGITRVSMAQITRHRHFTFDIMSLRYVSIDEEQAVTEWASVPEAVREAAETGEIPSRGGVSEVDPQSDNDMEEAYWSSMQWYRALLDQGVPQEEARKVLPMGTRVNIVMSGNARAWMHLLNIRGKANVQGEARRIADGVMGELKDWMPYTFEKYDDDVLPRRLNP